MFAGKTGAEGSMMAEVDVFVRSDARRRALAVARRDGIGGGGERAVVRVVRKDWDGGGREWARMALWSWGMRSIGLFVLVGLGFVDCGGIGVEVEVEACEVSRNDVRGVD